MNGLFWRAWFNGLCFGVLFCAGVDLLAGGV